MDRSVADLACTSVVPSSSSGSRKRTATTPSTDWTILDSSGSRHNGGPPSSSQASSAASVRPKSAGIFPSANRKLLLMHQNEDAARAARAASPSSRVLKPTFSSSRVGTKQEDHFCTKFNSPRATTPRPPSAASALVVAGGGSAGRLNRFRRTDAHKGGDTSNNNNTNSSEAQGGTGSNATRVGFISQRVMKEEIETQRRVTREAQRQAHALQHTLVDKNKEIELVKRHLSAFESPTAAMAPFVSSPQPAQTHTIVTGSPSRPFSTAAAAVLAAGAQSGGSGARHRESIAAAASLTDSHGSHSTSVAAAVAVVSRLKDQVHRQDLYKKKLKQMLDRLCRHAQFVQANLELLRHKLESTRKEATFFQSRLVHERNHCAELERKKHELVDTQSTQLRNAMLVLDSLREEIASRSMMSRHRDEADRRRQELLTLVAASPSIALARTGSTDNGLDGSNASRKSSAYGLAARKSKTALTLKRTPSTSLHRGNSAGLQQRFHHRETIMQVYEGQYAQVLDETGESDLSVVIERFASFQATTRHLLQIEREASQRHFQLEREREAHDALVKKLRVSGLAEVEKRKKIRDFLEQMHHVKALVKCQAKEKFVEQLKMFSYVQQGISNIVELLKCLDDRIAPPAAALASPLSVVTTPAAVSHALLAMVHFCIQVVRHNPGAPIVFTATQAETLRAFVSDHLEPKWKRALHSSLRGAVATATETASRPDKQQRRLMSLVPKNATEPKMLSTIADQMAASARSKEVEEQGDGLDEWDELSSESDTEDTRREIKRSEKDTLQQVEALLMTLDAKQRMSQELQSVSGTKPKQRGGRRAGSVHLTPALELGAASNEALVTAAFDSHQQGNAGNGSATASSASAAARHDKQAGLDAVHAFFKEKKRRERQDQQQHREVLAILSASSHSSSHPTTATKTSGSMTSKSASMAPTKQSDGVAASNTGVQIPQQPQVSSAVVAARRPSRLKTVR